MALLYGHSSFSMQEARTGSFLSIPVHSSGMWAGPAARMVCELKNSWLGLVPHLLSVWASGAVAYKPWFL